MSAQVDVLLSTYNNINYLKELLFSLNRQTYKNSILKIRDDGSNDVVKQFIKSAISGFNNFELTDSNKNIGYFYSFCKLINSSKSELIFLCDHDDIWHNNKIETFVNAYEQYPDKNNPILIYSDLDMIDSKGQVISSSFFKAMNFLPNKSNDTLFIRNSIPGCAIAFNQPLKKLFQKTKKIIPYHDHILVLLAIIYGKLIFVDKNLTSYRIHSSNAIAKMTLTRSEKINNIIDIYRFNFSYKKLIESRYSPFLEQIKIILDLHKEMVKRNGTLINDLTSNKNKYFAPRNISERIELFFLR
ncbi:MAG: glycosyltransferase [Bacteroidia bacterium]|nr:glycosyltransferase [Bacteroidia bacterium]